MTEVPKIVYDRLQAALPGRAWSGQAHPDADLLTAFAEQALSATEREGVLEHLALCGDCREVVAVALPAADLVDAPVTAETAAVRETSIAAKAQRTWLTVFAWPSLRWAALAAGVALAASILLWRPENRTVTTLPSAVSQIAVPAPQAPLPQIASPLAKTDEALPKAEMRLSEKLTAKPVVTLSPQAKSGMLLANNEKDSAEANKLTAAPPAEARAFAFDAPASSGVTETVEVSSAAVAVEVSPPAEGSLMARNVAPIEKAKPALPGTEVNAQPRNETAVGAAVAQVQVRNMMSAANLASTARQTLAHNVTWAISAGVLQRSLDSGQSWQDALHADHSLLCYANHDLDVWAGGLAGTLFHSPDGGVTWVKVQPSFKDQALSSDITHIDLHGDGRGAVRGPAEIVVSDSNNEIWNSADGGKTWDKK